MKKLNNQLDGELCGPCCCDQLLHAPADQSHSFCVSYGRAGQCIQRRIRLPSGRVALSEVQAVQETDDVAADHDLSWLAAPVKPAGKRVARAVSVVDMFAGCGAFSLGIWEAARALELRCNVLGAIDYDRQQAATFGRNFPEADIQIGDVNVLLNGNIGDRASEAETRLVSAWRGADFLIGGPPCQGHSNLNNVTRRTDDRNLLSIRMARAAELLQPKFVLVENVPTIANDKHRAADRLQQHLEADLGYDTIILKLKAEEYGVAQTRHRAFIIGWQRTLPGIDRDLVQSAIVSQKVVKPRPVEWCWSYMPPASEGLYDTPPAANDDTIERLRFFEENAEETNLPNLYRPDCHRTKAHTYDAVYGRMRRGAPAPTMTTGFSTMGRGRFVHPSEARLITPHEAARIQFFPEFFRFEAENRAEYARAIGNAVPPKLGYVIALALLGLTS